GRPSRSGRRAAVRLLVQLVPRKPFLPSLDVLPSRMPNQAFGDAPSHLGMHRAELFQHAAELAHPLVFPFDVRDAFLHDALRMPECATEGELVASDVLNVALEDLDDFVAGAVRSNGAVAVGGKLVAHLLGRGGRGSGSGAGGCASGPGCGGRSGPGGVG